ncbi:hypothetical protein [Desertivirga arenae]|uniref:hypothetical protein n=1 Tax=Desertivirga arenae TaxID=2810309 RepID=UPI001A95857D|nr:hypothetical protein [Pedobacter sp. SYSU D00823]
MVISILKLLVILLGILATFWYLIAGLRGKDDAGYKKAGTLLILTFLLASILSVIQQKLHPQKVTDPKSDLEVREKH